MPVNKLENSLRDVMILLIYYPMHSFQLSTWEVAQLFYPRQRALDASDSSDSSVVIPQILPQIFQEFGLKFGVPNDKLTQHFGTFYNRSDEDNGNRNVSMRDDVRELLYESHALNEMLSYTVCKLLSSNSELVKWEYSRFCCKDQVPESDLFLSPLLSPLPSQFHPSYTDRANRVVRAGRESGAVLTRQGALRWMNERVQFAFQGGEAEAVVVFEQLYAETVLLCEDKNYLPFSIFPLFALKCFYHKHAQQTQKESKTGTGGEEQTQREIGEVKGGVQRASKDMLDQMSKALSSLQQRARIKVLPLLFFTGTGPDLGQLYRKELVTPESETAILALSARLFDQTAGVGPWGDEGAKSSPPIELRQKFLPPPPPLSLWDAPRAVEYCRFTGMCDRAGSLSTCWIAFGTVLHHQYRDQLSGALQGWAVDVVPPVPVPQGEEVARAVLECIAKMCVEDDSVGTGLLHARDADSDADMVEVAQELQRSYIQDTILPMALSRESNANSFRFATEAQAAAQEEQRYQNPLEDILRFGGAAGMDALFECGMWLECAYEALSKAGNSNSNSNSSNNSNGGGTESGPILAEPPLALCLKFLSCLGLLPLSTVAMQAKLALHCRNRPSGPAALSFPEFEELFVRCAFVVWVTSSGVRDKQSSGTATDLQTVLDAVKISVSAPGGNGGDSAAAGQDMAKMYLVQSAQTDISSDRSRGRSWGVDFLRPYARTIRACAESGLTYLSSSSSYGASSGAGADTGNIDHMNKLPPSNTDSSASASASSNNVYVQYLGLGKHAAASLHVLVREEQESAQNVISFGLEEDGEFEVKRDDVRSELDNGGRGNINEVSFTGSTGTKVVHSTEEDKDNYSQKDKNKGGGDKDQGNAQQQKPNQPVRAFLPVSYVPVEGAAAALEERMGGVVREDDRESERDRERGLNASMGGVVREDDRESERDREKGLNASMDREEQEGQDEGEAAEDPSSPTRSLLYGTKEALWPVYGTYCSCGDSIDPGKLSGPNLFALLSKLGVLADNTLLSDIGILLHQISAHTHSSSVSIAGSSSRDAFESPSLSFEEFLVFLCVFAQLRFDGEVTAPIMIHGRGVARGGDNSDINNNISVDSSSVFNSYEYDQSRSHLLSAANSQNKEVWLQNWKALMGSSEAFRLLMEESVLPVLRRHPLLAYPQDARHRDKYSTLFSLEVLLAVEGAEHNLRTVYSMSGGTDFGARAAVDILSTIRLLPEVMTEEEVLQIIADMSPAGSPNARSVSPTGTGGLPGQNSRASPTFGQMNSSLSSSSIGMWDSMIFPHWVWIVCAVAYHAVDKASSECREPTPLSKMPSLVAEFITSVASSSAGVAATVVAQGKRNFEML